MPKYRLTTIEKWEHKVTYGEVEADTIEDAYEQVTDGNLAPDDWLKLDDGDEVLRLWTVEDEDGNELCVVGNRDNGGDFDRALNNLERFAESAMAVLAKVRSVH